MVPHDEDDKVIKPVAFFDTIEFNEFWKRVTQANPAVAATICGDVHARFCGFVVYTPCGYLAVEAPATKSAYVRWLLSRSCSSA